MGFTLRGGGEAVQVGVRLDLTYASRANPLYGRHLAGSGEWRLEAGVARAARCPGEAAAGLERFGLAV